jgi:beta-aspartyl-peptidase (threonine type)
MSERSESSGVAVAVAAILVVILLLLTSGTGMYLLFSRQRAMVLAEMARSAEAEARIQAEQARAIADLARANQSKAAEVAESPSTNPDVSTEAAVESVLKTQQQAWNSGKIDEFMEHYWKSDQLTFSSGGKVTRGWTATLNRYREKYPTPEKMGTLSFDHLEVTSLGTTAALVLGEWKLDRESEPVNGNFSLVMRQIEGRWVITHDHTSQLAE